MRRRLVITTVAGLVVALAALTGTAIAGECHGHQGGSAVVKGAITASDDESVAAQSSVHGHGKTKAEHGNSPKHGQAAAVTATTTAAESVAAQASLHGRGKAKVEHGNSAKHEQAATVTTTTTVTVAAGVKPSTSTSRATTASASSQQTKLYGNGTTAGQIAAQAGAAGAMLHGPGNSQPHKVSCGSHEIDVHALKSHVGACSSVAGAAAAQVAASQAAQAAVSTQAQVGATQTTAATTTTPSTSVAATTTASNAGGVKGTAAGSPKATGTSGGVLGSTANLSATTTRSSGQLPFTGMPLWIVAAVAAGLVFAGAALRRAAASR